jgi:hypothetical protein
MKCPKCSYISYDYNLICPKCDKDISSEQEKLHLPAFRPDPPFLLGALTGEAEESHIAGARDSSEIAMSHGEEVGFDDESSHFDSGEVSMPESEEFELGSEEISLDDTDGLSLDSGNRPARGKSEPNDILGMDLDTEDAIAELNLGGPGEYELGSDTGELEIENSAREDAADDELSLDLGEGPENEGSLDLESLDLGGGPGQSPTGTETVTRELRLDRESTEELDKLLDMDEIRLDEVSLEAKTGLEKGKGGKPTQSQESELSLDLGELDLELDLEDSKPH